MSDLFSHFDVWLWVTGVTQFLLAVLGIFVALKDTWAKKHVILVILAFVVLGLGGLAATIGSGQETARTNADLTTSVRKVSTATTEIERVTNLNTQLQTRLMTDSDTIKTLSMQNLRQLTGGDSICYISTLPDDSGKENIFLLTKGSNHILDVQLRVADLDVPLSQSIGKSYSTIPILFSGTGFQIDTYQIDPTSDYKRYNVFVTSRSGILHELLRLRKVNGVWTRATRVDASYFGGLHEYNVFEEITKGFPVDTLKTDKDWTNTDKLAKHKIQ